MLVLPLRNILLALANWDIVPVETLYRGNRVSGISRLNSRRIISLRDQPDKPIPTLTRILYPAFNIMKTNFFQNEFLITLPNSTLSRNRKLTIDRKEKRNSQRSCRVIQETKTKPIIVRVFFSLSLFFSNPNHLYIISAIFIDFQYFILVVERTKEKERKVGGGRDEREKRKDL